MSQGRGGAAPSSMATAMALLCLLLAIYIDSVHGATYTVGGPSGWAFNTDSWPKGKRFKAGDVLAFNYDATVHDVVVVNKGGYSGCTAPAGAKSYKSGKDKIKLVKGPNYFICSVAGHCQSGMKIAINAA